MIGDKVAEARQRLGVNQSELARRAELTPAAVWQIERGERTPSADTLKRLAEALRVSSDWLLGTGEHAAALAPEEVAMFRGLDRLSERDRKAILDLYRNLSSED